MLFIFSGSIGECLIANAQFGKQVLPFVSWLRTDKLFCWIFESQNFIQRKSPFQIKIKLLPEIVVKTGPLGWGFLE